MKAVLVSKTGGPEVLEYVELPSPRPQSREVLVRVRAAGVNFIDIYLREGRYAATRPFVLGQEGCGIVEQVGADVIDSRRETVLPGLESLVHMRNWPACRPNVS